MSHDVIKTWGSPVLKKIRSTLVTDSLATDTIGWSSMKASEVLTLEQALTLDKWWTDIGIPKRVEIDGLQGHIYWMMRREKNIAI